MAPEHSKYRWLSTSSKNPEAVLDLSDEKVDVLVARLTTILESNGVNVDQDTNREEFAESLQLLVNDEEFLRSLDEKTASFFKRAVKTIKSGIKKGQKLGRDVVKTLTKPVKKYQVRQQTAERVRRFRARKKADKNTAAVGKTSGASIGGVDYQFAGGTSEQEEEQAGLPRWTTKLSSIKPIGVSGTIAKPPKPQSLSKRKIVVTKAGLRAYPPRIK